MTTKQTIPTDTLNRERCPKCNCILSVRRGRGTDAAGKPVDEEGRRLTIADGLLTNCVSTY